MNNYTVQFTQYGITEIENFRSETEARERYAEIIVHEKTTEAWLFDGPEEDAVALEHFHKD